MDTNSLENFKEKVLHGDIEGFYHDVPDSVYHHKDFPGISASKLSQLRRSVTRYEYAQANKIESTDAMEFGRAFHCAILTPEIFESSYIVEPKIDKRTKEGKIAYEEFLKQSEGKELIAQKDYDTLRGMRDACHANVAITQLLKKSEKEVAMLWYDDKILCKGKADILNANDVIIADIKTTDDCRPHAFRRTLAKYFYDRAAAFYLDGATQLTGVKFELFAYVVIEKEPPYDLGLYVLDRETIETGRRIYKQDLQRYSEYLASKNKDHFKSKEFVLTGLDKWAHDLDNRQ